MLEEQRCPVLSKTRLAKLGRRWLPPLKQTKRASPKSRPVPDRFPGFPLKSHRRSGRSKATVCKQHAVSLLDAECCYRDMRMARGLIIKLPRWMYHDVPVQYHQGYNSPKLACCLDILGADMIHKWYLLSQRIHPYSQIFAAWSSC